MRIRTIKPGFFSNDMLAEVEPLGRLLFAGLWCMADRAGRLEDRPRRIKAEALPYDDCDADALLDQLAARGFILRYEANGSRYIQIVTFSKHQYPNQREPQSAIPPAPSDAPDAHDACTVPAPNGADARRVDIGNSLGNSLGEREQGGAGGGARASHVSPVSLSLVKADASDTEAYSQPPANAPADPQASRMTERALFESWVIASGLPEPKGAARRTWVKALDAMHRDYGLSPPEVPRLIAQYRAKFGADRQPSPGQVESQYPQLGVSPHVAIAAAGVGHGDHHSDGLYPPDYAERKGEAFARYGIPHPANHRPAPTNGHQSAPPGPEGG